MTTEKIKEIVDSVLAENINYVEKEDKITITLNVLEVLLTTVALKTSNMELRERLRAIDEKTAKAS